MKSVNHLMEPMTPRGRSSLFSAPLNQVLERPSRLGAVAFVIAAVCLSRCGNPARKQTNAPSQIVVEIPEGVPLPVVGPPPQGCSAREVTYFNRVTIIQNFR